MTHHVRLAFLTAAMLGALASPTAGLAQNRLIATVGTNDSQVITLTHENGAPVNDIPAGTYTIEVRDRSSMHNFHLTGAGVDQETSSGQCRRSPGRSHSRTRSGTALSVTLTRTRCAAASRPVGGRLRLRLLRRRHRRLLLGSDRRCLPRLGQGSRSPFAREEAHGSRGSGPAGT
jgi:hypothetical protein